jgi:hypothetical protein
MRFVATLPCVFLLCVLPARAGDPPNEGDVPKPVELTSQQDHAKMMERLVIKELRRGADGNNLAAPNAANRDEAKATPYPKLPDPLVFDDGSPKTQASRTSRSKFNSP